MKASPHGARVVPTVADGEQDGVTVEGMHGTTRPFAASPQSGWARTPETM